MGNYDSGRASDFGGISVEARRADSLNGIRFDASRADPTSSNDVILYRGAGASLRFWDGSSVTTLGSAGAVANFNLNDAYDDGSVITVDADSVTLNANISNPAMQITQSGSGDDIQGTSDTWAVDKGGIAEFAHVFLADNAELRFGNTVGSADAKIKWDTALLNIAGLVDFDDNVTMQGTLVIAGSAGSISLQLTDGDALIDDGALTITDSDNAASFVLTNNTITDGANLFQILSSSITTKDVLEIKANAVTTGTLLYLETSAASFTGNYIQCFDGAADDFTVGLYGAVTITGNAGSDVLTLTDGDVSIADGAIVLADTDNDTPSLSITNNIATTTDVVLFTGSGVFTGVGASAFVAIKQSGLTTGDAVSITVDAMTEGTALLLDSSGTMVTTGALLEMLADSATTAAGVMRLSVDGLTSGNGVLVTSSSIALTSGELLTIQHSSSGNLAANSGNVVSFSSILDETAGIVTSDYDLALFNREDKQSFAAQYDAQGSVVKIVKKLDKASGTIVDAVIGLEIESTVANTALPLGDLVKITEIGVAAKALNIVSASTSVSDVLITGSGVKADNKGVLEVTSSGATAAGGAVLRVGATGTPAAATSYLVDFEYKGATTSNNPDCVHISQEGTGRALHIEGDGLQSSTSPTVDIESTNTGAVGAVLRLNHQPGSNSQTASDVVGMIVFQGEDDASADNEYGRIDCVVVASTAGSESGRLDFFAGDAGGGTSLAFEALHDGSNGIIEVGDGSATGILRSNGNFDLQIETGNSTTGNITIVDGANGNITLTPNGSGQVDIANVLLLSKTQTISGSGAIDVVSAITELDTGGGGAYTLVDGTEGQIKLVVFKTDPGTDAVVTPSSRGGYAKHTMSDAGDCLTLLFTNAAWYIVGQGGLSGGGVTD